MRETVRERERERERKRESGRERQCKRERERERQCERERERDDNEIGRGVKQFSPFMVKMPHPVPHNIMFQVQHAQRDVEVRRGVGKPHVPVRVPVRDRQG